MNEISTRPIGATKGPGEGPHEYLMVAADPEHRCKHGEYVYYRATVDGHAEHVYGRVSARRLLKSLPDAFMADAAISPYEVTSLLGVGGSSHALYEITVTILGFYDAVMGFVNPRVPPAPGEPIYIAEDERLRNILCSSVPGEPGAIHVGSLLSRPADSVPIALDARGFTSTHLAIIASTGSGKSYLAGVMIEELMQPHNRAAVLIIDPHGEYDTLAEMANQQAFEAQGYRARVSVIHPDQVKVRVSSLGYGDLVQLLPNPSEKMINRLRTAMRAVERKANKGQWTLDQLLQEVRAKGGDPVTDPEAEEDSTADALTWRLNGILDRPMFRDFENMSLDRLLCPGQCTVLQLNDLAQRDQQIVTATLLQRLYRARVASSRGEAEEGSEDYLPYPGFVLIEEAHNFAPAGADLITSDILKRILSEGRKFGLSVGLISQRPGKLDSDVLSQCMTQCIMRIVNPVDQARIAESVETVGRDLLMELPALSRGQVIVAGASVNTPVLVQVRQRLTRHGGENPDALKAWADYFSDEQRMARQRDNAPPSDDAARQAREEMGSGGLTFSDDLLPF